MGNIKKWFATFSLHERGFTLVELLVVVGLLGVLAVTLLTIFNPNLQFQKARDARRKSDLRQITTLLNEYYNDNQRFPLPGSCGFGNYYVNSAANTSCGSKGSAWISELVPKYAASLPVDPINNAGSPWDPGNYSYSYGNVSQDGQTYDLTTQLENPSDPARCGLKDYTYWVDNSHHWCTAFGGAYSNQIYEYSPPF